MRKMECESFTETPKWHEQVGLSHDDAVRQWYDMEHVLDLFVIYPMDEDLEIAHEIIRDWRVLEEA